MTPEDYLKELMAHRATLEQQLQKQRQRAHESSQYDLSLLGFKPDGGLLTRFWMLFFISFLGLLIILGLLLYNGVLT